MKIYNNKSPDTSPQSRCQQTIHFTPILLAVMFVFIYSFNAQAQKVNIDNSKINIGNGAYITTDGDITLQNSGAIDNSGSVMLKGDWINNANGLINSSHGTVEFNGSSVQVISGTAITDFYNANLDNSSGASLGNNAVVNGVLTLTNGKVSTGIKNVELAPGASISGADINKYIYGNLKIDVIASGTKNFAIGDATTYAPVDVNINNVSAAGSITASTLSGVEPNENNPVANSSGINQNAKANRYWNLANNGVAFTNYDATFHYDAAEATGDPLNYVVREFSSSWAATSTGIVTNTSIQATGLTSFSEYEAGEANAAPAIVACPSDIAQCSNPVTWATPLVTGAPAANVICIPSSGSSFALGNTVVNCTASNINGSSSCSFNVIINTPSTAATSASSNAMYGQVCLGGSVTLTQNGGSLGTGASWIWYEGGCGTGASIGSGSSINITPSIIGSHTYYVRAEAGCTPTACKSVTVNVISAPPSGTIHYTAGLSDGCVSAPATAISVNAVANCTFYRWTSTEAGVRFNGNPSPFETTIPTVNVTFVSLPSAGSSGWSICIFGGNACGNTNNICTWVRATVSTPGSIVGSVTGCPGSSGNAYSSAAVAGAVTYQWTGSAGITVTGNGSQAVTVGFSAGFVSGTLSVHGQTACGYNGADKTITITRAPGLPGAISGTSYPCPNASATFSVTAVPGAATYTWTTSVAGAIVTGNTNTCSIAFPASIPAGSTVSVTANSSCPYPSAVRSKGIASGLPNVPGNISGPSNGQCAQTGVSYSISPVANATGYSWNVTCGTIQGPNNLSGISMDWAGNMTNCTVSVISSNACGNSGARTLLVTGAPNTPTSISGNLAVCAGAIESYCASGSNGAYAYQWIVPAGASILGPSNGSCVLVLWGSNGGTLICKASNDCGISGSRTQAVAMTCRSSQVNTTVESLNAEVYPNPAIEKATLKFRSSAVASYHLNMTNTIGQIVISTNGTAIEGVNMVEMDLSTFAKGIYMLNITSGDNTEQIRIAVQ